MDSTIKIILDYGFESFDEMIDILEHWERDDKDNNLFFENGIDAVKELYNLTIYQWKVIRDMRGQLDKQYMEIEKLWGEKRMLCEKIVMDRLKRK